jgi:ubiquinone/menaquinone biosynthesis C-methylase UbiE
MFRMPVSDDKIQRAYRVRIIIFLIVVVLITVFLGTAYQLIQTLARLEVVEHDRDQWQRPSEILQELDLREGSVVADIGCGVGYFALKLSSRVGQSGEVLAVDIQREPLIFLWIRTWLRHQHNLHVIHGDDPGDPRLSQQAIDAVLIVNTYHEFDQPKRMLDSIIRSLRSHGRLVIADRGPRSKDDNDRELERGHHELSPNLVESDLRQSGFQLVKRQDRFIDRPEDRAWWLIVARKP